MITLTAAAITRRPSSSPDRLTVVLWALAAFLVVLALLAAQLQSTSAHAPTRRTVVIRRIYRTQVIETIVGSSGGNSSVTQSVSSSGSPSVAGPAPTTRTS